MVPPNWNPIFADPTVSYVQLKTNSLRGSDDTISVSYYHRVKEEVTDSEFVHGRQGGFDIMFSSTIMYYHQYGRCWGGNFTPFPRSLPQRQDKEWLIEMNGKNTEVYCNGEKVLHDTESEMCYVNDEMKFLYEIDEIKIHAVPDTILFTYYVGKLLI